MVKIRFLLTIGGKKCLRKRRVSFLCSPMPTLPDAFLERLAATEPLSPEALERAKRIEAVDGLRVDLALNQLGLISDDVFTDIWSQITDLPLITAANYPQEPIEAAHLTPAYLRFARVVPLAIDAATLDIAVLDPLDLSIPAALAAKTGLTVRRFLGAPFDIHQALERLYPSLKEDAAFDAKETLTDIERLRDQASDAPVIRRVQSLLEEAVQARASDVHLTLTRNGPLLRLRIDGVLRVLKPPPLAVYAAMVSRLKIQAQLDIAENRLPQDGSLRTVVAGREIDVRVSTMPHVTGEGIVLRLLDKSRVPLDLAHLGVSPNFIAALHEVLAQPSGLVLMTGPTGSGKTTTLYAALALLARADRNVVTIEDPVEYHMDHVTQIEVNAKINFDFATALRSVLRQDPDVILIGEIRDGETARIATRAAMTGHLVLASLHTNSAVAAIPRLIDMGVEPYFLASTLRAVMAQRLLRRARDGSYSGRIAVTEFLKISPALKSGIHENASAKALLDTARTEGFQPLFEQALALLEQGVTTRAEIDRVLGGDDA
jgi:general secretion pathway protein E